MNFKFTGESFIIALTNDAKFEEEITCRFETDMRNLTNFDRSTRKSQKFVLNGLLLTKVYNVRVKKYRRVIFDGTQD